jgi:deferrochelatase/peroxidase EfeB
VVSRHQGTQDRPATAPGDDGRRLSRRGFLGGLGAAGVVGAGVGAAVAAAGPSGPETSEEAALAGRVAFHGAHQAGIATPSQDRLAFAAFDVVTERREELRDLLREWTAASAAMTHGVLVPGDSSSPTSAPADTGEAMGLPPSALTVTVGFGPSLFDDRFGLSGQRPSALVPLPALPGDALQAARSGGDLAIQACAHDPQVAFHVIHNLTRIGQGVVRMRWSQLGFGRTSTTSREQTTPRNLMGFKDGTRNVKAEDTAAMNQHVWADGDQPWMRGGTYLVARRIRMVIEVWDRERLAEQEDVFGRRKNTGAPLTGTHEFDQPVLSARHPDGKPVIPDDAHVRLASPESNGGTSILRRGFSYTDGMDEGGLLDAGLFFLSFQRDPVQFVSLQRRLGAHDALSEYIRHTGSGVWACPTGLADDTRSWADHLFG